MAAGAALYEIMSNLVYRTTSIERTVPEALIEAAELHGMGRVAVEDPVAGTLTYRKLLMGARILGEKLMPLAPEGKPIGADAAERQRRRGDADGADVGRPRAGDDQLHRRRRQRAGRLPRGEGRHHPDLARLHREGPARRADRRAAEGRSRSSISTTSARPSRSIDKLRGFWNCKKPLVQRKPDDWAAVLFTSGSEGTPKGVVLSHRNMLANAAQAAARIDFGRQDKVFNVLPVFHSFGLDGRPGAAAGLRRAASISIRRRCITASCRSWCTA